MPFLYHWISGLGYPLAWQYSFTDVPSVYEPSFGCSVKAGALGVDFLAATPSRDTKIILLRNCYDGFTSMTSFWRDWILLVDDRWWILLEPSLGSFNNRFSKFNSIWAKIITPVGFKKILKTNSLTDSFPDQLLIYARWHTHALRIQRIFAMPNKTKKVQIFKIQSQVGHIDFEPFSRKTSLTTGF